MRLILLLCIMLIAACTKTAQRDYIPAYLGQNNSTIPINENNWHDIKSVVINTIKEYSPYEFIPSHDHLTVEFQITSPQFRDAIVIAMPYVDHFIKLRILDELENLYYLEGEVSSPFDFEIIFY